MIYNKVHFSFKTFLENSQFQGAGILAIAVDTGKWLIGLRSNRVKEPRTWCVIGGKVEYDEDIPDAAKREFVEETKYVGNIKLIKAYIHDNPLYHNFIAEINSFDPKKNWETEQFKWVSYNELLNITPKHFGLELLLEHSGNLIANLAEKYQGDL